MQHKKTVASVVSILWGCLLAFFVVATPVARGTANPDLAEDVTLTPHQPVYQRSFDFAAGERVRATAVPLGDTVLLRLLVIDPEGLPLVDRQGYGGADFGVIVQKSGTHSIQIIGEDGISPTPVRFVVYRLPPRP